VPNRLTSGDLANAFVMGLDGLGDTIDDLLDSSLADGQGEDGQKVVLNGTAVVSMHAASSAILAESQGPNPIRFFDGTNALTIRPHREQWPR
jgi:hypothetical protein